MDPAALTTTEVGEDMKKVLECPVCLIVPRKGPIYQCKHGHCFCATCQPSLKNCPMCRIALGNNPARNLVSEELLSKMAHSCKLSDQGCSYKDAIKPLEAHEEDCEFRLVHCPDQRCQALISMRKVLEHIQKEHHDCVKWTATGAAANIPFSPVVHSTDLYKYATWVPIHCNFDGQSFFIEMSRDDGGQWLFWVYMLGTPKKCKEYKFSLKLAFEDKMGKSELTYKGPCMPLDYSKQTVAQLANGLILNDAQVKRFLKKEEEEESLEFDLSIRAVA